MKQSKMFTSDPRNLGGRTQIVELMHNHQSSLQRIKPVLKITSPRPHVDSGKLKKTIVQGIAQDYQYAMVRATYRTIASLNKGLIDRSMPITFGLIPKLSANKKHNKYFIGEHLKNMNSLQHRLKRIDSGNVILYHNNL